MEEARLTAYLFQRLQDAVFLTERNMAEQLGPTKYCGGFRKHSV